MPHAIQIPQTGGPKVPHWAPVEVDEPGSGLPAPGGGGGMNGSVCRVMMGVAGLAALEV